MATRGHRGKPAAGYSRMLRVNQVLRQVLAEEIERLRDADERLARVTITEVDVAGDLSLATIYVDSLSQDQADALEDRRVHLQRTISRQVTLKRTPKLRFAVDPSIVAGARIDELLRKAREEDDQ
ncbi:MAG: 30S ribosome-binding factor RbfA [Actinomycetota bacterium]